MKVTVITPTTTDRYLFNLRIIELIKAQDYPDIEHILDYSNTTIGAKRNALCTKAKGEIILHADSDDYYAPDWVSKSVLALGDNDMTGLREGYFYQPKDMMWKYHRRAGQQPYCLGATMCYKKSMWGKNKFNENVPFGEDSMFCANAGRIVNHDYITGFIATIHGNNTSSHTALKRMTRIEPGYAKTILGINYDKF